MMETTATVQIPEISREELLRRLADPGLVLVNVLSPEAFASGRIPGSINLPLDRIDISAHAILSSLECEIVVYCGGPT